MSDEAFCLCTECGAEFPASEVDDFAGYYEVLDIAEDETYCTDCLGEMFEDA